ncbi:MAG: GNAT family N-acetyltransferase [Firmicutes bacterium]|jgi:RimJ/RimL family protein N-acetyltransferase|nr:GNAT family N-acetyltransferase [Bacillota bacterium]
MIITLTGDEKRIRSLRQDDLDILREWDSDPELQQLTGRKFDADEEMTGWWTAVERDRSRLAVAIVDNEGRLIGDIELENVSWRAREAELRIAIGDKTYWNRGFGTEALTEMANVASEQLGLKSLYLRVSEKNVRAIHSYRKVGFRKVGRLSATGRLQGRQNLVLMRLNLVSSSQGVSDRATNEGLVSTAR